MDGSFARRHGAIGQMKGGLAIFPDEATGEAAGEALLNGPTYSSLTIDKAIEKRSSKEAGNDPENIKQQVHQFSGLPGDAIIKDLTPEEKQRLYAAIRRTEGQKPGVIKRSGP